MFSPGGDWQGESGRGGLAGFKLIKYFDVLIHKVIIYSNTI